MRIVRCGAVIVVASSTPISIEDLHDQIRVFRIAEKTPLWPLFLAFLSTRAVAR